jgi:hypothetical protein
MTSIEIVGSSIALKLTFDDHIVHNNARIYNVDDVVPISILERMLQNLEMLDKHTKRGMSQNFFQHHFVDDETY